MQPHHHQLARRRTDEDRNYEDTPRGNGDRYLKTTRTHLGEMGIDISTIAFGSQARWLMSAPGTRPLRDALDRLIKITDPTVQDTALAYDERDNLISVTDPNNVTTTYVRDGLDNLLSESSPDVGTTVHTYDAAGNRIQSTDARGVEVQYGYDALNRMTTLNTLPSQHDRKQGHEDRVTRTHLGEMGIDPISGHCPGPARELLIFSLPFCHAGRSTDR